jgi:transcriptional regulator with XRE-family HTH domain
MDIDIKYKTYDIRLQRGLSVRELSKLSGVSKSTINRIENNECNPTLYTICKLAAALNIEPHTLYDYQIIKN